VSSLNNLRASRAWLVVGAVCLVASGAAAVYGAARIGDSVIDVALDVAGEPVQPRLLAEGGGADGPIGTLTEVPSRFATSTAAFKLTATGERNPEARGSEVWLVGFPFPERLRQDPAEGWDRRAGDLVSVGASGPATISFDGPGPLELRLVSHPWSGIALLETLEGVQTLDLYSPEGTARVVPIPVEMTTRYHLQIPRRALAGLALEPGTTRADRLKRLYIGTLIPRVFVTHAPGREVWGHLNDDWRPEVIDGRIRLGSMSPLEQGGPATIAALWMGMIAFGAALALLGPGLVRGFRLLRKERDGGRVLGPSRPLLWVALAVSFLLVWSLLWFAFYPGLISIDAVVQWEQLLSGELNDHHPAFFTFLIGMLSWLWDSPAVVIAAQLPLLAAVISHGFVLALRAGASVWVVATAYALTLLSPQVAHLAIALVKDVPYSIVLLGVTLGLAHHVLGDPRARGPRFWGAIGVLLALATLFRHNGILVTVGMVLLLPLFLQRQWRGALIAAVVAAVVLLGVRGGLYSVLDVQGRKFSHSATTFLWNIGALVEQDAPFSAEEYAFLGRIRTFDDKRWLYSPTSVATTIWGDPDELVQFETADAHLEDLARIHHSLFFRYPLHFGRHLMRATSYLYWIPRPVDSTEINDVTFFLTSNSGPLKRMAKIGHPLRPVFPRIHAALAEGLPPTLGRGLPGGWIPWRPALWMYLGLAGVILGAWRLRDARLLVLAAPMVLNTISLAFGVAQESRFQLPVFISVGFLICMASLPRPSPPPVGEA
jgi:hypothetical protein